MDSFEVCTIRSWPQSLYEVALNFEQVRAKLARSSCEVGPKFVQSWSKVRAKLARSFVAKVASKWKHIFLRLPYITPHDPS